MIDLNDIRKELERKTALTYEIETTEYIGGRVASTKRKTFRERSVTLSMDMADAILEQLKEQEREIERLEHDLCVAENNLNYYVNGNE